MVERRRSEWPGHSLSDATPAIPSSSSAPSLPDEEPISFTQLAERIPGRSKNRRIHASSIHRYRSPGIRGVKLYAFRIGGRWFTTMDAFKKFCSAVTATTGDGTSGQLPSCTSDVVKTSLNREGY